MTIYLYKKTHLITGLKYLGKTSEVDPHAYRGSGTRWLRHINKHGYIVETEILKECQTNAEVKTWGLYYSKLWDIVNSSEWANLKEETGAGGACIGYKHSPEIKEKISKLKKGQPSPNKNKTPSASTKEKISKSLLGRKHSKEVVNKRAAAVTGTRHFRYNHTVYLFIHLDGSTEQCTQNQMQHKHNLTKSALSEVVRGLRRLTKGWSVSFCLLSQN